MDVRRVLPGAGSACSTGDHSEMPGLVLPYFHSPRGPAQQAESMPRPILTFHVCMQSKLLSGWLDAKGFFSLRSLRVHSPMASES
eukprot:462474-Amphidinium_carterae.1